MHNGDFIFLYNNLSNTWSMRDCNLCSKYFRTDSVLADVLTELLAHYYVSRFQKLSDSLHYGFVILAC